MILFSITLSQSSVDVLHQLDTFFPKRYNALPSVEISDNALQLRGGILKEFLQKAASLAKKHDLLEVVGIRLLHRHNDLNDQEFMGENYGEFEGKEA